MNRIGYQLLSLKRVKDAIAVFIQNTIDFPDAFNTWDSLAEGDMISGDKASAIKYYKKSLQLNPDKHQRRGKTERVGRLALLGESSSMGKRKIYLCAPSAFSVSLRWICT